MNDIEYGAEFWKETRINNARWPVSWEQKEQELLTPEATAIDLAYQAQVQRDVGPAGNKFWPGIECAMTECRSMAVEGFYFCSRGCRDMYMQQRDGHLH